VLDVVEALELGLHRLAADFEDLAEAAAERHGPGVVTVRLPVRRDDRRGHQIPAVRHVVVDERPDQQVAHVLAVAVAGERP
jgi:hypothetical protein